MATRGIDWFTSQVFTRTGLADLPAHLQDHYGIAVAGVTELDVGVYRVMRADGPDWVARVFPAERCAAESPVSVLDGQPVLVTEFVPGKRPRSNGRTYAILGALLGRLHSRPGDTSPPDGGSHHLTLSGTPVDEVEVTRTLLAELKSRAAPSDDDGIARLDEALEAAAATTTGLPECFVHPDFVLVNAIATAADSPGPGLTILDWTNSGFGPRVWSLAFVLWVAGARDLRLVDAFIARYRRHVTLEEAELTALPLAIAAAPSPCPSGPSPSAAAR